MISLGNSEIISVIDKRDLDLKDLLEYFIAVSDSERSVNEIVNICSGKGMKLCELAMSEAKQQGKENLVKIGALPYRNNEVWEMVGDSTKMSGIIQTTKLRSQ